MNRLVQNSVDRKGQVSLLLRSHFLELKTFLDLHVLKTTVSVSPLYREKRFTRSATPTQCVQTDLLIPIMDGSISKLGGNLF